MENTLPSIASKCKKQWRGLTMRSLTITDAYQAIDEVVMAYQHEAVSAERAMSNIAAIIADYESGTDV